MRSKTVLLVGVILMCAGAWGLFYRSIPYTSRDVVIDVGPLKATTESSKSWPVPPLLGGLVLFSGAALIFVGARKAI